MHTDPLDEQINPINSDYNSECTSAFKKLPLKPSSRDIRKAICSLLQSGYRGSEGYESMAEGIRPVATSQSTGSHTSAVPANHTTAASFDSYSAQGRTGSPSKWSSSSPSASWGRSQALDGQQRQSAGESRGAESGASDSPSLLQKVKGLLPGQSNTTAEHDASNNALVSNKYSTLHVEASIAPVMMCNQLSALMLNL